MERARPRSGSTIGRKRFLGAWAFFALALLLFLVAAWLVMQGSIEDCTEADNPPYCEGQRAIGPWAATVPAVLAVFALMWGRVLWRIARLRGGQA